MARLLLLLSLACGLLSVGGVPSTQPVPERLPAPRAADLYGDDLPPGALARLGTVRFRHGARIESVAVSPDGKFLASGGRDHHTCVWEAATGKRFRRLAVGSEWVYALAFSGDGNTLAACLPGNHKKMHVRLLDVATGKQLRELEIPSPTIPALAFAQESKELIHAAAEGEAVVLYATATGKVLRRLEGYRGKVLAVDFAPDGRTLASAGTDNTVRRWDTATGRQLQQVTPRDTRLVEGPLVALAFAPDG